LCAASDRERLMALKRAVSDARWEQVGGAVSVDELVEQIGEHGPDVVVLDLETSPDAVRRVRAASGRVRVVAVGPATGADQEVAALEDVRGAVLASPRPRGPVRT
jgi:chemotaxis response regulator CheB